MQIPSSFISQLVSNCDIEDIISSYVNVKHAGRNAKCICPFHSEKTPSLVVYNDTQSFFCFGCGAGGDVITFIMRIENLGYSEAVEFLARRAGMSVPDGVDDQTSKLRSTVLEMNKEAARFFNSCLNSDVGKPGYDYFKKRNISDKIIKTYGLGYAPDSWDKLINHLKSKGYTTEQMYKAALVSKSVKSKNYYDSFRNRVMFPIIDLRGNVIAFGGRVLDDSKPKYLNTADTVAFKKSRNLFSLNLAKNEIKDKIILAEGYMDVITVYSAGFKNVVATLGTALTPEQARLISKYTNQVIIAYDSDNAGQAATQRAINLFSEVGITTKTLNMDGAKDPDEYIKKFGVKRFGLLIDGAENIIEYEFKKLASQCDLET
ncbi:MAG: DNA primase, partial [Oscillospiraceae bacterium]